MIIWNEKVLSKSSPGSSPESINLIHRCMAKLKYICAGPGVQSATVVFKLGVTCVSPCPVSFVVQAAEATGVVCQRGLDVAEDCPFLQRARGQSKTASCQSGIEEPPFGSQTDW